MCSNNYVNHGNISNYQCEKPFSNKKLFGCDTGLGYSIVMRYLNGEHFNKNQKKSKIHDLLFFNNKVLIVPSRIAIVAFCLNPNSPGAKYLHQLSLKNNNIKLFVRQLDLTDTDSIKTGVNFINDLLQQNIDIIDSHDKTVCLKYELHALVNNAARMVMAEYEWQTSKMIKQQFEVNILGPIMLTGMLLPIFRKDKSRVINVISHCAYLPLPGVSVYGATKAAVRAWTIGSRVELENHGVKMITFSPGSFYLHSSIMNGEQRTIDFKDMCDNMNKEQLAYYGAYMQIYQNYLSTIDAYINPPEITIPSTNKIYCLMDNALWAVQPKAEYNVPEPWRYRIYFAVAWTLSSLGLHYFKDKVVRQFVATPQFHNIAENVK
ncbi:D-beta-hydroxybutyrate dehydrogenase, mitochondrial isoform X2 [Rhopalosiphum padi]|uniref:D-beta-hydroxybutyrate dehydrogenase, mitochondrial isoform X2 n=1 Tax=Rhopalosiphum padi TaxID=40932 RepID=UPI00298DF3FF|nr:D-beta-hydroxybutyrate dehydrogenase, mitochondrial isoform X2 [Rhopalosiphum padi]XP_060844495.1 D-beta-hydroxybutyrate dehydrogenase, mitochondrial isoform X2 [Rhopalosiphum padi]XP_060844496.1 D-beta-hydroxybutyrate dehydrogenase, mitochondrial isoform X2 [Rhopalosiphum padi]